MSDLGNTSTAATANDAATAAAVAALSAPGTPQDALQQQGQLQQGQLQQPLIQNQPAPSVNSAGENLQCQWQGCGERCSTPEALYEHVCERHVGRKSTNNLNLTCAWGTCRTTTVKRDHITSHIRVHVPLKPHKCDFCGKAFKRPQDLKKHVKTHADDSVIMRSPNLEPNGGQRQSQNGMPQGGDFASYYGHGLTGQVAQSYYGPAMPGPQDYTGQHHANQYYQPHSSVPTGQHPGYGPVTYYSTTTTAGPYDFEARKRGYDALDQFFGQVKRRELDPVNFHNISRRLFELQGLQLPQIIPSSVPAPAYQPVSVGGAFDTSDPIQAYSLPPMGNAKTREDLTSIDQILEQMQATIYENDTHLGSTGVGQSGSNYVAYRTSNSPPSTGQMASTAAQSNPIALLQHQHQASVASTADASTPGLTPPSSAQSYTSGQSPMQGHAAPTSNAMYPSLPSSASDMAYAAANAATLSGIYESEERRRYSGGMLQRAAPAKGRDEMDTVSDGSATPPALGSNQQDKGKDKDSPQESVIDPALAAEAASTPKGDPRDADQEQVWVQNMRLIEWMREFIKKKLESGEYENENDTNHTSPQHGGELDHDMTGTGDQKQEKTEEEQLYPVLQAVAENA
ncbi:hypothetical protein A1O1_01018 [Capronia coronata CBS 617.96]|uniref:pH-response transcription factor pacC/RIM101 n=1 Tax=Capronia coronata CBS 617.96 TaxID=1182541 RepID=W9YTR2_9EURO|nr:uncharacterized protein A1O1_01018 [Capronia coronata CBS 617.96]EXJ95893.1 hypothetical protein A1O1_01018 [Capronia coronata CBS 617.96]